MSESHWVHWYHGHLPLGSLKIKVDKMDRDSIRMSFSGFSPVLFVISLLRPW